MKSAKLEPNWSCFLAQETSKYLHITSNNLISYSKLNSIFSYWIKEDLLLEYIPHREHFVKQYKAVYIMKAVALMDQYISDPEVLFYYKPSSLFYYYLLLNFTQKYSKYAEPDEEKFIRIKLEKNENDDKQSFTLVKKATEPAQPVSTSDQLKKENLRLKKKLIDLTYESKRMKTEFESKNKLHEGDSSPTNESNTLKDVLSKLSGASASIKKLESDLEDMKSEKDRIAGLYISVREQNVGLENEMKTLKDELAASSEANASFGKMENDFVIVKNENKRIAGLMATVGEENSGLKDMISTLQDSLSKLSQENSTIPTFQGRLNAAENEKSRIADKMVSVEEESSGLRNEIIALKDNVSELSEANASIGTMKSDFVIVKNENDRIAGLMATVEEENTVLKKEINTLKDNLKLSEANNSISLKAMKISYKQKVDELNTVIENLRNDLELVEHNQEVKNELLKSAHNDMDKLRMEKQYLKAQLQSNTAIA